jgi:hypothetical protein
MTSDGKRKAEAELLIEAEYAGATCPVLRCALLTAILLDVPMSLPRSCSRRRSCRLGNPNGLYRGASPPTVALADAASSLRSLPRPGSLCNPPLSVSTLIALSRSAHFNLSPSIVFPRLLGQSVPLYLSVGKRSLR